MKILVTAGSTRTMIDQVRCLTNIFGGRTGATLAYKLQNYGRREIGWSDVKTKHEVVLITSNKQTVEAIELEYQNRCLDMHDGYRRPRMIYYKTFDELAEIMKEEITTGSYDVVIHSAAVSDFQVARVCTLVNGAMVEIDASAKISSKTENLYFEMKPTFKIVDKIRKEWGFKGKLVKFKLQVDMSDEDLIEIAKKSRATSEADIIVANCLEWSRERAFVIGPNDQVKSVVRDELPIVLAGMLK